MFATIHENTPAEELAYTRWANLQAFKQHKAILQGFYGLIHAMPNHLARTLGIPKIQLQKARDEYQYLHLQTSKTFTVCPICQEALTGKKQRKATKSLSTYHCNICDKPSDFFPTNRKIHFHLTLAEANTHVRTTHPELFL